MLSCIQDSSFPLSSQISLSSERERESEVAQSCLTLATSWTAAYQAPPSMGFSRQKYWSGMPLPSPYRCLVYINKKKQADTCPHGTDITAGGKQIICTKHESKYIIWYLNR